MCNNFIVRSTVLYVCPVSSICCAKFEFCLLVLKACMCSYWAMNVRPVCPTYLKGQSELLYDWRFTTNQFVFATSPFRLTTSKFFLQLNTRFHCSHSQSESFGTHDLILLSQIQDSPNLEGRIHIPQRWWSSYTSRNRVPISSYPMTRRPKMEVFGPASTRNLRGHPFHFNWYIPLKLYVPNVFFLLISVGV
jgi:hypothetical protein